MRGIQYPTGYLRPTVARLFAGVVVGAAVLVMIVGIEIFLRGGSTDTILLPEKTRSLILLPQPRS